MSDPEITYGPYRLEVRGELKLLTPMHIGSGERLGVVTDDPVVRFANQPEGTPFIPGSSLRGVLRSRLEREQTQIRVASNYFRTFFGEVRDENSSKLSRLRVFDSFPISSPSLTQVRDHVRHDPETGAAMDGAKFDREVALPARYSFRAVYYGEGPSDRELRLMLAMINLLENAWIHTGSKRGLDYGRLQLCNVSWLGEQRHDPTQLAAYLAGRLPGASQEEWRGASSTPITVCHCTDDIDRNEASEPESILRVGLRLQCKGPVLVKATFAKSIGDVTVENLTTGHPAYGPLGHALSDSVFVERDDSGRPYLPAESLRGVLRTQAYWAAKSINTKAQDDTWTTSCRVLFGSVKEGAREGAAGFFEAGDGELVGEPRYCYLDHVAVDRIVQSAVDEKKFDTCGLESPVFQTSLGVTFRCNERQHLEFFIKLIRDLIEGQLEVGSGTTRGFGTIDSSALTSITLDLANDFIYAAGDVADEQSWYARRILRFRQPCWGHLQHIATALKPKEGAGA